MVRIAAVLVTDNWQDGGFALEGGVLVEKNPPLIPPLLVLRGYLLGNALTRPYNKPGPA